MKTSFFITVFSSLVVLTACSSVEDELADYSQEEMQTYMELSEEIEQTLEYMPNAAATEEEVYDFLSGEVMDLVEEKVQFAESVELEHEETQELHDHLVEASEYLYGSLQTELRAMEEPENAEALLAESDQYWEAYDTKRIEFDIRMDDLEEEYDDLEYIEEPN